MYAKEDVRTIMEAKIQECEQQLSEYQRQIAEIQEERNELVSKDTLFQEYIDKRNELFQELEPRAQELVKKKERLKKKEANAKWLGIAFLAVFIAAIVSVISVLRPASILFYVLAVIFAILFYKIPVSIKRSGPLRKIRKINSDPKIIEYEKDTIKEYKDYQSKLTQRQNTEKQYNKEISEIKKEMSELENHKRNYFTVLEELEYNCAYAGTILFYGRDKRNHYELYIDGRLYGTVRGHDATQIKLTPGLHSFRVTNTSYNIVDRSVDYSYSFNTEQLEVGDIPEAFMYVCEFKTLSRVRGREFESISKTTLI